MGLEERRKHLIEEIDKIDNEQTLVMLEESLSLYVSDNATDVTDDLDEQQLRQLTAVATEAPDANTVDEPEFQKMFARWNTR